jgi:hypothetical protein
MKSLVPQDFVAPLAARWPDDSEMLLTEMLECVFLDNLTKNDTTAAIELMMRSQGRQQRVLKRLNDLMAYGGFGTRQRIDVPHLQNAARVYRDELRATAKDPEVATELDRLIAFRLPG